MSENLLITPIEIGRSARASSAALARLTSEQRNQALIAVADGLEKNKQLILAANAEDCQKAAADVEQGRLSAALFKRLKLDDAKFASVIDGIRQISRLPDPLGEVTLARELDDGLQLFRVICPIGVVLVIFEARPDALPQILSLLIKSGNAGLLKGGSEAKKTNEALFRTIEESLDAVGFPAGAYRLIAGRHEVKELLSLDKYIDLVIPRGSGELVREIQSSTRIPVLGHAEGICHLYVDESADLTMASKLAVDAKTSYPAACNSIETILVHKKHATTFVPSLVADLESSGVEVRMTADDARSCGVESQVSVRDVDWTTEYSDLVVSLRMVDEIKAAIEHVNEFGSGHTETIVARDKAAFERFFAEVNSGGVYWNASTRFADGFRYGFGAEVGISTSRLHPRGPVGVDGITTYKYKLVGDGHVVSDYTGENARAFKHKELPLSE